MKNTRTLQLPGGGSFAIPMPDNVKLSEGSVLPSAQCRSALVPVLAGVFLGGVLTWAILAVRKN